MTNHPHITPEIRARLITRLVEVGNGLDAIDAAIQSIAQKHTSDPVLLILSGVSFATLARFSMLAQDLHSLLGGDGAPEAPNHGGFNA